MDGRTKWQTGSQTEDRGCTEKGIQVHVRTTRHKNEYALNRQKDGEVEEQIEEKSINEINHNKKRRKKKGKYKNGQMQTYES